MNNDNEQQREDYNRAVGIDGRIEKPEKPVMDSVSPMLLLVVTMIIVAALSLLGWGIMIVFGM